MRYSATLLAVAVVFGSVEVRIGDETFTLGAGDSRVFAEEAPPVEKEAPPVAKEAPPVAKEAPPAKEKGDLDADQQELVAKFLEIHKGAISGKIARGDIRGKLQVLGITWQEGIALARKAGHTLPRPDRRSAGRSAEDKVLDRWNGTWFSQVTLNPSRWVPEGSKQNEITEVKWILNGRFQQILNRSDNHETHLTQRYDRGQKKYQKWTFDTNGGHSYWLGDWDEKSQTMTWQFPGGGLKGTMTDRFLFADKTVTYETKLVIKDGEGTTLLDILSQHTRVLKK